MVLSDSELKTQFDEVIDGVLQTGVPVEFERAGRRLRIVPIESADKLSRLLPRPEAIQGDPEDLVHMDWSGECHVDLP